MIDPWVVPLASLRLGLDGLAGTAMLVAMVLTAFWVGRRAYRDTEPSLTGGRRRLLTFLRTVVLLLLVAILAEPVLHREKNVRIDPGVLLLVDDSASMGVEGEDGRTRLEIATELRERARRTLLDRQTEKRVWLGEGARRLVRSRAQIDASAGVPLARGEGTDLPALLLSSAQRHLEDNLAAILLLSDGRSTAARSPSLASLGIPVFAVAVGDTVGPADLRLDRVRYPTFVHRGDRLELDAEVVVEAESAGGTWAVLRRDGADVDSLRVSWPAGGGRSPLRFVVAADSLGPQRLDLRLRALPGEPLRENNAVQIGYEVRKDRLRLFYLESRPSWNYHFLSRLAQKDRRFEFVGVHRAEDGLRLAGTDSVVSWPLEANLRDGIDLWIAGSLEDAAILLAPATGVLESVRAGAGFWTLCGEAVGRLGGSAIAATNGVLPFTVQGRSRWITGEYRPAIAAPGRGHPVLALPPALGELERRLNELPPLRAVLGPAELRADADLLLQAQGGRFTSPLLSLREEGAGRVAAWLGSPLWSWSFWRLGDTETEPVFDALFGNLLSFLAEGGERQRLRLHLPGSVLAQGQEAEVRALALDPRMRPDETVDVWLEWAPVEQAAPDLEASVEPTGRSPMALDPRTPGGRVLDLPSLPPGDYVLRVALEEGEQRVESDWLALTIDPYSVEFRRPGVDVASLRDISRRTGGRLLTGDEIEAWAGQLGLRPREATLTGRLDLWASLWLMLPLLGVLSLEWALRKRWGLI